MAGFCGVGSVELLRVERERDGIERGNRLGEGKMLLLGHAARERNEVGREEGDQERGRRILLTAEMRDRRRVEWGK